MGVTRPPKSSNFDATTNMADKRFSYKFLVKWEKDSRMSYLTQIGRGHESRIEQRLWSRVSARSPQRENKESQDA